MEMVSPLISKSLGLNPDQVNKTILLLKDGATIPFISRYRKELTGSLDEVQILQIKEAWEKNLDLEKRRETVIKSISDQNKLSEELLFQLKNCPDITTLEDLYLPYKVKRKTKASIAKGFGLEPLADYILLNQEKDCQKMANSFLNENIKSVEEALSGARDIIAEKMNEDHDARNILRSIIQF
jgi:protein Tex